MTSTAQPLLSPQKSTTIALAWCLAWGQQAEPAWPKEALRQMRQALRQGNSNDISQDLQSFISQAETIQALSFPNKITNLEQSQPHLWKQPANIGLVYGGATKIKGYVFESSKLSDIRGASAILDQINLIDLPAFFQKGEAETEDPKSQAAKALAWLDRNFPGLADALIPELVIYSTGGNILAFCPVAYVDDLANAIEKRYSEETLTANSCAVGRAYRPLEMKLGVLQQDIATTPWLDWYQTHATHSIVESYYGPAQGKSAQELKDQFQQRRNFSEVVGHLTADFQKRRNGNNASDSDRPSRRYPPRFETHPYLRRDGSEKRSALGQTNILPSKPWLSESFARKLHIGRQAKRDNLNKSWFEPFNRSLHNKSPWPSASSFKAIGSWVAKFEDFLNLDGLPAGLRDRYYASDDPRITEKPVTEARNLYEISQASQPGPGFIAYIYADGNNMGGYIQNKISSPEAYRQFSEDIFTATEYSVYLALAQHLHPAPAKGDPENPDNLDARSQDALIHPFEIITIGGDDVLLIVPASQALAIAQTLGEQFEKILLGNADDLPPDIQQPAKGTYKASDLSSKELNNIHRYYPETAATERCILSTSSGVLITHYKTPIYYAENLTNQLLKTAKQKAKDLKEKGYLGGTIDFQVLKNVTMISSSIKAFRKEALTVERHHGPANKPITAGKKPDQTLQLHAAPYTLHELGGFLKTLQTLKDSGYANSQLYQVRSLLEQGKRTAMLNYHYFRARLSKKQQRSLIEAFEQAWCKAKTNNGTLSPWMSQTDKTYETIWRELVDLHPFVAKSPQDKSPQSKSPKQGGKTNPTQTAAAQSEEA